MKNDKVMVTIRVNARLAELYKAILVLQSITVTADLTTHMQKQTQNYQLLNSNVTVDNMQYSKLNIKVDRDVYAKYKAKMILNHTTPTADVIRYLRFVIEKNQALLNQN
ncbi:hypothetical protein PT285_06640 [Lactobacillus sp. ESL0791]|uniref:hypothetical protein n=1 Tax=Lactobacillus sp. ESL0791 TaxID=2983234 RepID=UPI0023F6500B|nr:hypothetical protein [Lactobacillus sp. ESL0791]MDF7639077.1 hypothetical protein [Lactobacillus sp. ESL0791]